MLSKAFETVTGTNLATQYYGAPEQRGGFKETDQRADVFSLGVLIYRVLTGRLIGFHDLEPIERYVQGLEKDTASKIDDLLNKATRVEVDQRLADISTFLDVFSPEQAAVEIRQAAPSGPAPGEQFLTALELAYVFSPDGNLPENVRATLITKSQEIGLDPGEAELLEKDFRSRLGLSEDKSDRVISTTSGSVLKTGEEKGVGTLIITSEPEIATVSVDGIERGATPLTIDRVGAGKKTIRLKMNGFFPVSRIERIIPDEDTKIHVILEHQTGSINVSAKTYSDAYPARFYLDGKLIGKLPLTVADVTAGTHPYRFEADNHQEISGEVVVELDEEVKLDKSIKALPGYVNLNSLPQDATVWINGKMSKFKTDVKAKIPAGKHTISLKLDSYINAQKEIEVLPGRILDEGFELIKNQGRINVVSIPEEAAIWLDDRNTKQQTDAVMGVKSGTHKIVLIKDGYRKAEKEVKLFPEQFLEVAFRLEKEDTAAGLTANEMAPNKRYAAIGNNIVLDTKTGLEWMAGPDKDITWDKAKSWMDRLKTEGVGWRMPTMDELEGIYEKGVGDRNMSPLLKTTGWWIWAGETKGSSAARRFSFFRYGTRYWYNRADSDDNRAFAVRSRNKKEKPTSASTAGETDKGERYVTMGVAIVKDRITGLEWLAGPDKDTNWNKAKKLVAKLKTDSRDWRMPTMGELNGLYEKGLGNRNMTPLLKTTGWWVWAGETKGFSDARGFTFRYGKRGWHDRSNSHTRRAFAVRSRSDG